MIKKIIKKFIFATILIYSFNLIAVSFGLTVPINYITVPLVTFLDIPAMFLIVLSLKLVF